jgi:hypothetical protein
MRGCMNKIEIQKGYEKIYFEKELICIIVRNEFSSNQITFFTEDITPQQLGYLPHKTGNIIKTHIHNSLKREIHQTNEILFIKKGKVKINLFNGKKEYIGSEILNKGDIIHLSSGGHGFEILEETIMFEVKQGPYLGVDDKERFSGIEK